MRLGMLGRADVDIKGLSFEDVGKLPTNAGFASPISLYCDGCPSSLALIACISKCDLTLRYIHDYEGLLRSGIDCALQGSSVTLDARYVYLQRASSRLRSILVDVGAVILQ